MSNVDDGRHRQRRYQRIASVGGWQISAERAAVTEPGDLSLLFAHRHRSPRAYRQHLFFCAIVRHFISRASTRASRKHIRRVRCLMDVDRLLRAAAARASRMPFHVLRAAHCAHAHRRLFIAYRQLLLPPRASLRGSIRMCCAVGRWRMFWRILSARHSINVLVDGVLTTFCAHASHALRALARRTRRSICVV